MGVNNNKMALINVYEKKYGRELRILKKIIEKLMIPFLYFKIKIFITLYRWHKITKLFNLKHIFKWKINIIKPSNR